MCVYGSWSIDCQVGVAYLFSITRDQSTLLEDNEGTLDRSDRKGVFNTDGSLALSYNFSPSMKLSAGYRADAYYNALPGLDFAKPGGLGDTTRVYHGAFLRLSSQF